MDMLFFNTVLHLGALALMIIGFVKANGKPDFWRYLAAGWGALAVANITTNPWLAALNLLVGIACLWRWQWDKKRAAKTRKK